MTTPAPLRLGVHPSNVYLGSPGRMTPLPPPKPGVQPEGKRYAAVARSLNGTGTEWFFGTKRAWKADLPWCTPEERAWLELCWDGAVQPLWLIDPLTPNRLPKGVASTGSTLNGVRAFTSNGTISTVAEQPAFDGAPRYAIRATGATRLAYERLPVVGGETLTFVTWTRADAPVTPQVSFTDVTGADEGTVTGDPLTSGAAETAQTVTTVPVPDRAAFATFALATAAATTIVTSAWRAATDGRTAWTVGGGCYRVAFTEKSSDSDRVPLETVSVTFEEL